ncbi:MAG: hypothetical protein BGN88_02365 [Clostridiales bacterium 43-6]|nr:MAG: hypothetical protein BGN88_02365 [Clostridiales bacterium 43-6]
MSEKKNNGSSGNLYPETTYTVDDILNELKLKTGKTNEDTRSAPPPRPAPIQAPASPPERREAAVAQPPKPAPEAFHTVEIKKEPFQPARPMQPPAQPKPDRNQGESDRLKSFLNKSKPQGYTPDGEKAKNTIDRLFEPVNEPATNETRPEEKRFGIHNKKRAPHALTPDELLGSPVPVKETAPQVTQHLPVEPPMKTTEIDAGALRKSTGFYQTAGKEEPQGQIIPGVLKPPVETAEEPLSTQRSIKGFVVSGDEEENSPDEILALGEDDAGEIDDYTSVEDAPSIRLDFDIRKRGLRIRISFSLIAAVLLVFLSVYPALGKLPELIDPKINPVTYLALNAGIAFVALLFNFRAVMGGFFTLFRFKGDLDTAVGTSLVFSIAHTVYMCFNTAQYKQNLLIYPAVAVTALVFNNIGKLFMISRISQNFELVGNANIKKSAFTVYDENAEKMAKGSVVGEPVVCCDKSVVNLHNFLTHSFCEDPADQMCQTLAPIGFLFSLISAVVVGFTTGNIPLAATIFTAILCVGIPVTSLLASNLPLYGVSKRLIEMDTVLSGYDAVDEFCDTNLLTIDAEELFPPGSVDLVSIKTSGIIAIDEAILDAAAVAIYAGGPLSDVFDKVIEGRRKLLPRVDSLIYEDNRGITGKVSSREVRIGNRVLMETCNIQGLPDIEYERRMLREGNSTVYLSSGENLAAMFVVRYHADEDVAYELDRLIRRGVTLLIKTSDANVTADKISELFELPKAGIKIMPAHSVETYEKLTVPNENGDSMIAHHNRLSGFAAAISACIYLRGNILFATILQTIGVILGFAVALFFAVSQQYQLLTVFHILSYQLIFAFLVLLLPSLRRP